MRFKEKIDYEVVVDASIDQSAVLIPPMLIQPFVENALKHGLQHKVGDRGFISIKMQNDKNMLVIMVEDNGIGRRAAALNKSRELNAYPSKGMTLTKDRIGLMNKLYKGTTSVEITDLGDGSDGTIGTRITIKLPLFREQQLFF
jgi:sensor histidine kinase YesM